MECVILDALEALGYKGTLLDEDALNKAAECGLASQDFCELCLGYIGYYFLEVINVKRCLFFFFQLKDVLSKVPKAYMEKPLLKTPLNTKQMKQLEKINEALLTEYECRRRMLMKRLDVTVQSFGWSDRAKVKTDDIARIYQPKRYVLTSKSTISIAHLLAAREDLSKIIRTSSGSTREKTICAINKVLMGRVPDRGGRPSEIDPPPPEMPPWQKRQDGGGRGGRGGWGGDRGRGGGNRGGGGW
ncbi:PREDICTED: protein FAM98B, partial [Thamnophis sirtalis]|uniref:Protein FAM98B n=1 Tax=Thamnophis sirtalis TaxID=35019 RepID=A0A6I9WZ06_9SAUR